MIPYGRHYLDDEDIQSVVNVLRNGPLTQGHHIESFEQAVARYVGSKYAVAVSSGTAALHLAAICSGLDDRDSLLITSPITFVATANAGLYVGANVEFADICPGSVNLDPVCLEKVLKAANSSTKKAVFPVHYAGLPCDVAAIRSICQKYGAVIVEDAAHALGAVYPSGSRVGSCESSLMTIFSFHPVKAIAAGEGGMITTNDAGVYKRLLRLRSHGINKAGDGLVDQKHAYTGELLNPWYYEMQELGFHYRITDIQCALAESQLKKLPKFLQWRRELVDLYDLLLRDSLLVGPAQFDRKGTALSAHHIYPVRIDFARAGVSRAELMLRLRSEGVGSQVHYLPVPMHPYYKKLSDFDLLGSAAMSYYREALSLPLYYGLSTDKVREIVAVLHRCLVA